MNKEEISRKGLELVAFSGEARTYYLEAVKAAKNKNFKESAKLIKQAEDSLIYAHKAQTDLIQKEAQGKYSEVTMMMVHGQDHLMTTILLRDILNTLIDIYRK